MYLKVRLGLKTYLQQQLYFVGHTLVSLCNLDTRDDVQEGKLPRNKSRRYTVTPRQKNTKFRFMFCVDANFKDKTKFSKHV